jgi:hypothetical protein
MVMCTTAFEPLAKLESKALGVEGLRLLVLEHPLGGIEEPLARERAANAWPQFRAWLDEL